MSGPDPKSTADGGSGNGAPQGQDGTSWEWLDALVGPLAIAVNVADVHGRSMLTAGGSLLQSKLQAALLDPLSDLRVEVARTAASGHPWTGEANVASAFRLLAACCALPAPAAGTLLIGRDVDASGPGELADVGPWLARAIASHLDKIRNATRLPKPQWESDEPFDRVSSLQRLLQTTAQRGAEREVVETLAESLFAWDGIELSAYVEDLHGRWTLTVATPGSTRGHALVALDSSRAPRTTTLTRLGADELEGLGFARTRTAVAIEVRGSLAEPWVFVFLEGYAPLDITQLSRYAELLHDALDQAATVTETRTTWSMMRPLCYRQGPIEPAIEAALHELAQSLDAISASIAVVAPGGGNVLLVGEQESSSVRSFGRSHILVSSTAVLDLGTLVITLRRAPGRSFTRREQLLVDRAGQVLSVWLPGGVKDARARERRSRTSARDFEEVLDRTAARTVSDGTNASVVVLSVGGTPGSEQLQRWVADIRAQLRGSDLAGMLSDHEVGVLLCGASADDVPLVSARLQRCFSLYAESPGGTLAVGIATRNAESLADGSLVRAARQNIWFAREARGG